MTVYNFNFAVALILVALSLFASEDALISAIFLLEGIILVGVGLWELHLEDR